MMSYEPTVAAPGQPGRSSVALEKVTKPRGVPFSMSYLTNLEAAALALPSVTRMCKFYSGQREMNFEFLVSLSSLHCMIADIVHFSLVGLQVLSGVLKKVFGDSEVLPW